MQYCLVWQNFIDVLEEHTASILRKVLAACLLISLPGPNDVASTCLQNISKHLPDYMYHTSEDSMLHNLQCFASMAEKIACGKLRVKVFGNKQSTLDVSENQRFFMAVSNSMKSWNCI
jgi:hypothetical protein